jgi:hypothetical protein
MAAHRIEAQRPARKTPPKSNDTDAGFGQLDKFEEWRRKKHAAEAEQQVSTPATPDVDHDGLGGPTQEQIIKRAQEAWERLVKGHTWLDWLLIGEALLLGRTEAMHDAQTNQPTGRRYAGLFGAWLQKHGFDAIDKSDRSRLFECLGHRAEIEVWRTALPLNKQLSLNHPSTVLHHWKASTQAPDPAKLKKPSIREAHAEALEQIDRLEKEIARGGADLWTSRDRARDIAKVMIGKLSRAKAEAVARSMLEMLKKAEAVS